MSDGICFAGLDVHARKTAAAAVQVGLGGGVPCSVWPVGQPRDRLVAVDCLGRCARSIEAGPTGFGLARAARAAGIEVMVCSPGAIRASPAIGSRPIRATRSSSRVDAAGQLRAVVVPEPELEALRDLVRAARTCAAI